VAVLETDPDRKATELRFANGVTGEISVAHTAKYAKSGGRPQITPAAIHDDLRGRDFTINSIALSLNPGSRGLLLDPTNGLADLERRELRANSNYSMYDDPSRILRMFRLQARMGLSIDPRTQTQYENVREAGLESKIPARCLLVELRRMADEPQPALLAEVLEKERLWGLFNPGLAGPQLNLQGLVKLEKIRQMVPFGSEFTIANLGLFLSILTEKLPPKERAAMVRDLGMPADMAESWQKLESKAKRLETVLKGPKLNRASLVYKTLREAPGELVLFLALRSTQRLVHDRIKNYLQKYLAMALEVTDRDLAHLELAPDSPELAKAKDDLIFARLDGRIRKPAPPEETAAPAAPAVLVAARR
jgi:tRNA nucleotidyltransferase/poly(A) polymerase